MSMSARSVVAGELRSAPRFKVDLVTCLFVSSPSQASRRRARRKSPTLRRSSIRFARRLRRESRAMRSFAGCPSPLGRTPRPGSSGLHATPLRDHLGILGKRPCLRVPPPPTTRRPRLIDLCKKYLVNGIFRPLIVSDAGCLRSEREGRATPFSESAFLYYPKSDPVAPTRTHPSMPCFLQESGIGSQESGKGAEIQRIATLVTARRFPGPDLQILLGVQTPLSRGRF